MTKQMRIVLPEKQAWTLQDWLQKSNWNCRLSSLKNSHPHAVFCTTDLKEIGEVELDINIKEHLEEGYGRPK